MAEYSCIYTCNFVMKGPIQMADYVEIPAVKLSDAEYSVLTNFFTNNSVPDFGNYFITKDGVHYFASNPAANSLAKWVAEKLANP